MFHMFLSFSVALFAKCTDQAQVSLQLTVFLIYSTDFSPILPGGPKPAFGGYSRLRESVVLVGLQYTTQLPRQHATV